LLLGLERLLSEEEPTLVDGTVLSAHQVDALSGTLPALLAEAQRTGNGNGGGAPSASPELLASADILGPEDVESDGDGDIAQAPEHEPEAAEEPRDWVDEDEEEALAEQPEDPNAAKRFWFEHATGAGKTVAALGFVE